MKIQVWTRGSPTEGIMGESALVDIPNLELQEPEDIKYALERMAGCFGDIWQEKAYVQKQENLDPNKR